MRVCDIECGEANTIELRPTEDGGFEGPITTTSEVGFFASDLSDAVVLRLGDRAWEVQGVDEHHQGLLERLTARNLPQVAWIAAVMPGGSKDPTSIVVEVREFPSEYIWPGTVDLGVDEKIVDAIRQKRKRLVSISGVVTWLSDKFLLSDPDGRSRVLLSGSPTPQSDKRSGFRLYGKGVAVDIARDQDDRLIVTRLVEARRPINSDERRPVLLIRGQLKFVDYTIAGHFRGAARTQLDQLVEDADSYLGLWREYNELERQSILRRAQEFGWLRYSARRPLADGKWRFTLSDMDGFEGNFRLLEDNESLDLEAALLPPAELNGGNGATAGDAQTRSKGRVFAGECVGVDRRRGTVDLRLPPGRGENDIPPPDKGVLFISLSGDRKRLERREKAQSLIASAECPMPQLGLLIEGKIVPERRRKQEKPLSVAVRKAFGGEPTGRQIDALKIALNTPDIALIQGPPGTGKTRIIAALQTRLSEIAEDTGIAGRSLLTSYQHDAVENVASATQVFGLPAIKIGQKRGQTEEADGFERWRRDRVEAVSAQLAEAEETPAAVALRRCRDLAIGYLKAPSRSENLAALVGEVRELAAPHIPHKLVDELLDLQQGFRCSNQGSGNQERDLALKAVRGLRVDAVAFSDDGPLQALKVIKRTEKLGILTEEERALLYSAAECENEDPPGFLDELCALQQNLIDRLLPDQRPANAPLLNSDIEALFNSVIDALRERVRSTKGGVESVLYEFRDDLDLDRRGAREAVERYTMVLAATCQQAVGYQMSLQKGENVVFETVVVDEAARANPLDLFIPMSLAERRIILVGDHRQLPHILEHEIESDLDKNAKEKTQDMLRKSLFWRLFTAMRERERVDGIKRTVTLDVQYRMHPVLGAFVSDTFYPPNEAFESGRNAAEFRHDLPGYGSAVAAWVDVQLGRGREAGRQSKKRPLEAKWIAEETHRLLTERPDLSVGVITFYSAQVDEILQHMEKHCLTEQTEDGAFRIAEAWRDTRDESGQLKDRLRVGTVDAFQGKEFDVVILSMTRSNDIIATDQKSLRKKYGHLMLENRLCVAMSRQKRLLIVVGDSGMLRAQMAAEAIPGLIKFHELCGGEHGIRL